MDHPRGTPEATKRKTKDNPQGSVKRRKIATMEVLVDDCLLKIFSYLKLRDLENLEQVSTRFQELARRSFSVYRSIHCVNDNITTVSRARTISAKVGPGLRRLSIYNYPVQPFTLEMLEAFLVNCPNIEHFEFILIRVQELGMLKLLDDFVAQSDDVKIKSVLFRYCDLDDSQDAMFFSHLERATNLEDVSVKWDLKFTGKWLKCLKNLKKIVLEECPRFQPSHFIEFCKRNKTLVNLNINNIRRMNQEFVNTIGEDLKNLQSLTMSCSHFPDSSNLSILGDLPKLEELEIFALNHLALPLLKRLAFHNKLRALKCFGIDVDSSEESAEIFREMVKIQGLKSFHLICYNYIASEFCDEHLKISPMNKLEVLKIQETGVTNQGLFAFILRNPALKTLQIDGCPKITDEFAQMIIPRLQTDFKSLSIQAGATGISEENYKILLNKN